MEADEFSNGAISCSICMRRTCRFSSHGRKNTLPASVNPATQYTWVALWKKAMMAAMAVSINDCSAKSRMLVSNIPCTTISSWMTSIPAANSVMHWEASSDSTGFILLEQEGREQRERGQDECRAEQIRHAEKPQLGVGGLHQHHRTGEGQQLADEGQQPKSDGGGAKIGRHAEREEDIHQQRHQDKLFDRGGPFDQCQIPPRVFEDHRLMYHGQLQVRRRVIHGNAARLGEQQIGRASCREGAWMARGA